jgi:thiol:disulfide interchange protein DsbD
MWVRFRIAILSLLALLSARAAAQEIQGKHARVALISQTAGVTPNRPLLLGVHFVLEKGWHIYWTNPGDSGQPPAFNWHFPEGFSGGEVAWPRPQRLQTNAQIVDYGYSDEVLLLVPVRTPPTRVAAPVKIAVDAKWLICREVCIPDQATLHLSLASSRAPGKNQSTEHLFADAERLLPRPMPPTWTSQVESEPGSFVLLIRTGKLPVNTGRALAQANFFPRDPGQIDNAAAQKVLSTASGVRIALKKSDLLLKPISMLRGVLVLDGMAYRVEAPVVEKK